MVAGYGNISPKTVLGKVVTIIYAMVGMPLFLLYVSNMGDVLATSFRWIYVKLCKCQLSSPRRRRHRSGHHHHHRSSGSSHHRSDQQHPQLYEQYEVHPQSRSRMHLGQSRSPVFFFFIYQIVKIINLLKLLCILSK